MNFNNFYGPGFPFMPFMSPNPNDDKSTQLRMSILPFVLELKEGRIPNISVLTNVDNINWYVTDFKDQGNQFFKQKNYSGANEMYTVALTLCRHLQDYHFVPIDKELLSVLFSNRAFCLLKMDYFKESIVDCDIALQQNKANFKAYYRKALALKSLRDYPNSLKAATEGRDCAIKLNKTKEALEFDEVIREIKSHLPVDEAGTTVKSSKSTSELSTKGSVSTVKEQIAVAATKKKKTDASEQSTKQKTEAVTVKAGSRGGANNNTDKGGKEKVSKQSADQSWLQGTNAQVSSKATTAVRQPKKKSASNSEEASKAQYTGRFATLPSDDDGDEVSDDESSSEDDSKVTRSKQLQDMGLEDFSVPVPGMKQRQNTSQPQLKSSKPSAELAPNPTVSSKSVSQTRGTEVKFQSSSTPSKPTDYPTKALSATQVHAAKTDSHPIFQSSSWDSIVQASEQELAKAPQPYLYEFTSKPVVSPQHFTKQVATPPAAYAALQKSASPAPKELLAGELVPMQSRQPLPYPFDVKYDFTLVCNKCYPQRHEGHSGYVALVLLPHSCERNHLVVRSKNNKEAHWAKIRPRNTKIVFLGPYKICRDFVAEKPCKQIPCSFAHYDEEVHLWTLDREGQFSLEGFVMEQQQYLTNDLWRSVSGQPQRPMSTAQPQRPMNATSVPGHPQHPISNYTPVQSWQAGPTFQQTPVQYGFNGGMTSNYAAGPYADMTFMSSRYADQTNVMAGATLPQYAGGYNHMTQSLGSDGLMTFPLSNMFHFKLVCEECLIPAAVGLESYMLITPVNHVCPENILAVQKLLGDHWVKIRELKNHRPFRGGFQLCKQYSAGQECPYKDRCLFPHSIAEQELWTLEKDGKFNIVQFIRENRNVNTAPLYDVQMLLNENPGEFGYLCLECFQSYQLITIQNSGNPIICGQGLHDWFESRILVHCNTDGTITLIGKRVHTSKNAFYRLCRYQQFCSRRWLHNCPFAHSVIERNVWCVERDLDMSQDNIVEEANRLLQIQIARDSRQMQSNVYTYQQPPAASTNQPMPAASAASTTQVRPAQAQAQAQSTQPQIVRQSTVVAPKVANVPSIVSVCSLCFLKGVLSRQGTGKASERCSTSGVTHQWDVNKIFVLLPCKKRVNQLPKRIPTNSNFAMCKHMVLKRHCDWVSGGCQFAHSQEEIDLWKWMVNKNVKTLEELIAMNQKPVQESPAPVAASTPAPWKAIPKGQTVVEVKTSAAAGRHASLFSVHANTHYCQYCSVHCNSQKQWDEHCASEKHTFNVNSDREHQWNYRQPPWGVSNADYAMCKLHEEGARCKFSDVPDMYNQCKFAHSREELDEWQERWDWRQMKRDIAKSQHLYSYMEQLREEYESTSSGISVLTEDLDGVKITCSSSLNVYEEKKNATFTWQFEIYAKDKVLGKVALLHDQDRLHFVLRAPDLDRACQIAQGEAFVQRVGEKGSNYKVQVAFVGGMFGSFSQWVVFDFGQRPVLVKKVNVELGAAVVQDKVRTLREKLKFDRWTSDNRKVLWMDKIKQAIEGDLNTELLQRYKAPSSSSSVITQETVGVGLNRNNYRHKMHKLLQIEELTQAKIISRYNLKTEVTLINVIDERYGVVSARPGELFARVPLADQLNDDTDAGHLILSGVTCVLLAPQHGSSQTVYEAVFVQLDNFNYNGRGSDYVYLCLSPRCCTELQLESGMDVEVEIQFQMNRLPFCLMHYAIDQLADTELVFPDVSKINHSWNEKCSMQLSSSVLNEDQVKIIEYIAVERHGYTAPLIVYGPFGTGKTETLAQAAMMLATQKMGARILICTRSNSAADVYILRHFDELRKRLGSQIKVLRVVATDRRMNTISPVVQRYCLLSSDGSYILAPTKQNILEHEIIITTLVTSLVLTKLDVRGHFTHIFVDEAAQVLECEAIMPLCLADEFTRVVLAGDHYQMSQKVYSGEARQQKFHCSLVERMYYHYKTYAPIVGRHLPNILLSSNYRTKMELVRFLAAAFYGGPDALHSVSNLPDVRDIVPLTFYTAQGREIQDKESTSYYNLAEVEEIVERVSTLVLCWPEEWSEPNISAAEAILVVTPYLDQVTKIRSALRKKGKELKVDLSRVNVERVSNIQGTEYHVVFLSTVRTRHLVEERPRVLYSGADECDGEYGDFGFLSDAKLLNTALTRARFMVAVVGDPVGLCAVGECAVTWRAYLKHCQNLNSIFPQYITLESLKIHVRDLMSSPYAVNVQIISKFNENAASGNYQIAQESESADVNEVEHDFSNLTVEPNPFEAVTIKGVFEDWNLDYKIEPDSIIEQLAKEARKNAEKEIEKAKAGMLNKLSGAKSEDLLKLTCIRLRNGHAVLHCDTPKKRGKQEDSSRRRKLVGDNSDNDYDSGSDSSDTISSDDQSGAIYVDYIPQHLHSMLQQHPDRYKRATMVIENSSSMYAKCIDDPSLKKVKLGSRYRCGRAFNGDEVVVEVLSIEPEDIAAIPEDERDIVHGQVIGILRRAINPKYRMFICTVDTDNTGVMIPINRSIPKIYNLETKDHSMKSRKGHICVYTFTRTLEVVFHHYEPVDVNDPTAKLFIVRYLKWDAKCFSPLGIVVGVVPNGSTTELAMNILSIEHYVPEKFKDDTVKELERLYPDWYEIPASVFNNRTDYRDQLTFTVDPEGSTDLDDAISVEDLPNNSFLIGVHIADVGYFVRQGSCIDQEAQARGATLYPVGRSPIPMLPTRLSSTLCSLLPGQDRLTVSVFITIDSKADVQRVAVKRCVIRSEHRLTYSVVEQMLKGNEPVLHDDLQPVSEKLQLLSRIAQIWRRKRLGTSSMYYPTNSVDDAPEAHLLIEELMITVNHHIALLLIDCVPKCTPLRTQFRPSEADLQEWRARFRAEARNTVALTAAFKRRGEVCFCTMECTCIPSDELSESDVHIEKSVWEKMKEAAFEGNWDKLQSLILDPENHPKLVVAVRSLQSIQQRSAYMCAAELSDFTETHHNSLNISYYTTFTSPIRCYTDLVIGRMVVECVINHQTGPYSQADIEDICYRSNDVLDKARKYELATRIVHYSQCFRNRPVNALAVVDNITESSLDLCFLADHSCIPTRLRVTLASLGLSDIPLITQSGSLILKWVQRLYDLESASDWTLNEAKAIEVLNANRFVYQASASSWKNLVLSTLSGNRDDIIAAIIDVNSYMVDPLADDRYAMDVTSEGYRVHSGQQIVSFGIELQSASVIQVQVSSDIVNGLYAPHLQLLNLTPTLDICLEHRSKISCFASTSLRMAARQTYMDVAHYQSSWLPVMELEAAKQAVGNEGGASVIIHHVPIIWRAHVVSGTLIQMGTCEIPVQFARDRNIIINRSLDDGDDDDDDDDDDGDDDDENSMGIDASTVHGRCYGYMCVRYAGCNSQVLESVIDTKVSRKIEELSSLSTWVGHCVVVCIKLNSKSKVYKLTLRLHQSSSVLPQQLLEEASKSATVEWIPKALPNRRAEEAVYNLERASQLARDIALGKKSHIVLDKAYVDTATSVAAREIPGAYPLNSAQREAVEKAVKQPFTVIQGPPGTGKTALVARLTYMFSIINDLVAAAEDSNSIRQVMVCGPSNKSVDVITSYLKELKTLCPRIVRVYSDQIERADYPMPTACVQATRSTVNSADDLRDVSLHHMVRSSSALRGEHSIIINDIDGRVKSAESISSKEVCVYKSAIRLAEREILRQAQIILCTCSVSVMSKIKRSTNICQLIIDECGMCTEPESLIPIVSTKASQVVLVGDHMQLQPIVTEYTAKQRGLVRSLFERYSEKAVMLTMQYRMHEAIAAFPSKQFYEGKLCIGKEEQSKNSRLKFWPNGSNKPIEFVHVVGCEQSISIHSSDGSEQSKFNANEAEVVVRAVRLLIRQSHVMPNEVAVLSQYRAQCSLIEKELLKKGEKDVTVSTVVSAQGSEWDYVILSTVRSLPKCQVEMNPTTGWRYRHLGFIVDTHQINVALTRARKGIIIVGNKYLLQCDKMWKKLLTHYGDNKKIVDASQFAT